MKNLSTLFLLGLITLPIAASAQTADIAVNIKSQIEVLKLEKTELKAQVESGEITREEAKEIWSDKITEIRAAKEAAFETRLETIKTKFAEKAAENPEYSEQINARLEKITTMASEQKAEAQAFRAEIKAKIQAGELTREEIKEVVQEKIEEQKEERAERQAEAQAAREEVQAKIESGEITQEEALEMRKAKIEELGANRPQRGPQRNQ